MKAYYSEGEKGERIIEKEVPEGMREEAKRRRHELIEKIVEQDDKLLRQYLEGKEPPLTELKRVLRKATIALKIIPVLTGSALKNKGVQLMLDAVVDYLPSPAVLPPVKGFDFKTNASIERHPKDDEPFSALAFKIATDPFVGALTFFRVYSGVLNSGDAVFNPVKDSKERAGRI